jgi:hypothetical protein
LHVLFHLWFLLPGMSSSPSHSWQILDQVKHQHSLNSSLIPHSNSHPSPPLATNPPSEKILHTASSCSFVDLLKFQVAQFLNPPARHYGVYL